MRFTGSAAMPRVRLRVGSKFVLAMGTLLLIHMIAAGIAAAGLVSTNARANELFQDSLTTTQRTSELTSALSDVAEVTLQQIPTIEVGPTAVLEAEVDQTLLPRVRLLMGSVRGLNSDDPTALRKLDEIEQGVEEYTRERRRGSFTTVGSETNVPAVNAELAARTGQLFDRLSSLTDDLLVAEALDADRAHRQTEDSYQNTWRLLIGAAVLAVGCAAAVARTLIRDLVPRIQDYSRFASEIASGRSPAPLPTPGIDELADLARALNAMVRAGEVVRERDRRQVEFVATLQGTANEGEAHVLVQRHLERALPAATVVILQRNNSDNRLEASTAVAAADSVLDRLVGAEPRACLALRFARAHREGTAPPPLLNCTLCGDRGLPSVCEPLLVSGEVIGSVLVSSQDPLDEDQHAEVKNSVAQGAPVLANLRNLALAELRANTDTLSGLPNRRASEDTLKRMVAQSNRSNTPMTVAMLDLDHFKQINDRFGHGVGDEVLAAVGAALPACLRASDFAGRYGGEEFLILLPETGLDAGLKIADKIRLAVASIAVTGVDRAITASVGVAELLPQTGTATGVVHEADQALYAAKAAGRNRAFPAATGATLEEMLRREAPADELL